MCVCGLITCRTASHHQSHVCMCVCMPTCMCVCMPMCMCVCMPMCMCTDRLEDHISDRGKHLDEIAEPLDAVTKIGRYEGFVKQHGQRPGRRREGREAAVPSV